MVEVFAMTCGWITMDLNSIIRGNEGKLKIPVPGYLLKHPKGLVLFDTGLHKSMQTDAKGRLGVMAPLFDIDFEENEDIAARLAALDVDVNDIDYIVNSHLHFDHCGGNDAIPNSPVVVQRLELEAASNPDIARQVGFFNQDWDHGHDFILADGEYDIFGDGSIVCVPTPGHTPGHHSLKVKTEQGEVVLAGDACYLRKSLEDSHLPSLVFSEEQMLKSFETLRMLEKRGAKIYYGHDPEFWQTVPQAPLSIHSK